MDVSSAERIRDILIEELQWSGPRDELTDDLPLIETRVLDSLGMLRLVSRLQSELAVEIRDEDVVPSNFGTIGRIAQFVDGRTSAR
jgi:acyl carrier protein